MRNSCSNLEKMKRMLKKLRYVYCKLLVCIKSCKIYKIDKVHLSSDIKTLNSVKHVLVNASKKSKTVNVLKYVRCLKIFLY